RRIRPPEPRSYHYLLVEPPRRLRTLPSFTSPERSSSNQFRNSAVLSATPPGVGFFWLSVVSSQLSVAGSSSAMLQPTTGRWQLAIVLLHCDFRGHNAESYAAIDSVDQHVRLPRKLRQQRASASECLGFLLGVRHLATARRNPRRGPQLSGNLPEPAAGEGTVHHPAAEPGQ